MMTKTRRGLTIIKTQRNRNNRFRVSLTRKTQKDGSVKHGVTLTKHGRHIKMGTFPGIQPAWELYKTLMAM